MKGNNYQEKSARVFCLNHQLDQSDFDTSLCETSKAWRVAKGKTINYFKYKKSFNKNLTDKYNLCVPTCIML